MSVLAWHFVGKTLRGGLPLPADGEWLEHKGSLVLCEQGLHASRRVRSALAHAPGSTICRVRCDGKILDGGDKLVCTRRKILWRIDGEQLLREFARWCASQVLPLWDAPPVVREYLATGNAKLRSAARAAAARQARKMPWSGRNDAAETIKLAASTGYSWEVAHDAEISARYAFFYRNMALNGRNISYSLEAAKEAANRKLTRMVMDARRMARG